MQSDFSKKIASLKEGDKVKIQGPFGKFVLEENQKNVVMLSGGIGITPLRSMIQYATDKNLPIKIWLFYSNKKPDDISFLEELNALAETNKNFKIIHTITRPEESKQKWGGHIGRIDKELISKNVLNLEKNVFYICGPPSMVSALEELVQSMNIPKEKIRKELFAGYE
ncbi:MAG: FAD-dependent oxidoreductase [Candidatus Diapherotrites archaeon]|nr:FAD-dependent oxidoreductase [Candidatus Diapherotrites archaeon]